MRACRGMGAINPSKMPGAKTIRRKDNPDDVTMYAKGGKATKFGAAMVKKSADTKGRAMVKKCSGGSMKKYAKGGSIDGCATKGKTNGKMV